MTIICAHCQNPAPYTPLEEMELHGVKVYYCRTCRAEYIYWQDGQLGVSSLYVFINDKMYRWSIYPDGFAKLWHFGVPGIPGERSNKLGTVLLHLNNNSYRITPQNIREKVKNILLFL